MGERPPSQWPPDSSTTSERSDPLRVRNQLRRRVEREVLAISRTKQLLEVEGDAEDLYEAVVRLKAERDELSRRLGEPER
jgi:hypothetical protein